MAALSPLRNILRILRLHETSRTYGCPHGNSRKIHLDTRRIPRRRRRSYARTVEQEAQIRLMEKLKNHKGHNSMLVLRPADAEETTVAWKLAMENMSTPTALIFSRQNIANLPAGNDYSQAAKGAYIVAGSDENRTLSL